MGGHVGFYELAYISCIHLWSLKLACNKEVPTFAAMLLVFEKKNSSLMK